MFMFPPNIFIRPPKKKTRTTSNYLLWFGMVWKKEWKEITVDCEKRHGPGHPILQASPPIHLLKQSYCSFHDFYILYIGFYWWAICFKIWTPSAAELNTVSNCQQLPATINAGLSSGTARCLKISPMDTSPVAVAWQWHVAIYTPPPIISDQAWLRDMLRHASTCGTTFNIFQH